MSRSFFFLKGKNFPQGVAKISKFESNSKIGRKFLRVFFSSAKIRRMAKKNDGKNEMKKQRIFIAAFSVLFQSMSSDE